MKKYTGSKMLLFNNQRKRVGLPLHRKRKGKRNKSRSEVDETIEALIYFWHNAE